jgi:uncharacterized protein
VNIRWRDVSDRTEPVCFDDTFDLSQVAKENPQIIAIDPLHVELCASMENQTCTVDGQMETLVTYHCSRCLTEFAEPLRVPFHEQFVQDETKADVDDDQVHIVSDTIELDPYIEQAVVLDLHYRPLCKETCQGLCPKCGANKNTESCSCDTRVVDPRLADLAKFFEQD